MKKSIGSKGISLIECINPRLTKYRVRFALTEYVDREFGGDGVEFYELEYQYKPQLETIVKDIIAAIPDEPITFTEIAQMAELLGEDPIEPMRKALLHNVEIYDTSLSVNGFYLGDKLIWIDIDLRVKLCTRTLPEEKKAGKTSTILWLDKRAMRLAYRHYRGHHAQDRNLRKGVPRCNEPSQSPRVNA